MFDRYKQSYHDRQIITGEDITRYLDETSAKYLKSCFNPELPMRCREYGTPLVCTTGVGIYNIQTDIIESKEVI